MSCNLPYTVEEVNDGVQKLIDGDNYRREKLYEVSELFSNASSLKYDLRKHYDNCTDISPERRAVIQDFLREEGWKDSDIKKTLGKCVSQMGDNISNKIRWMHKKNTTGGSSSQQATHQPNSPISSFPQAEEPVNEHGFTEEQVYWLMRDEETLREVTAEQARIGAENAKRQEELEEMWRKDDANTELYIQEFGEYPDS